MKHILQIKCLHDCTGSGGLRYEYKIFGSSDNISVGFNVDDVDAENNRLLTIGAEMLNKPKTHPWGARSFQFKDPDGNILNFRSMPKG